MASLSNDRRRPARAAKRTSDREEWLECIRHNWPMRHNFLGRALILYAIGQARGRRGASLSKP